MGNPDGLAMRRPNFFIVGAAKSGTTSMQKYLGQHPEISMPQKREPIFFGHDLVSHTKRTANFDEYLKIYSNCGSEKIVGEKSVWYLYSKSAAEEIREFNKDAKILIMLRNPVEMVYSLHHQFLSTGNENVQSFDAALALEDERAVGRAVPKTAHFPEGLLYTQIPLYCDQVARYLRAFGEERVQVIPFEEFSHSTAETYFRVLSFLEVSEAYVPQFVTYNKKRKLLLRGLEHLGESPSSPFRLLPVSLQKSLRWRLHQLNRVEEKRPPMSPLTRARLQEVFRPDVERLGTLLNRDFTHWFRQEVSGQSAATAS